MSGRLRKHPLSAINKLHKPGFLIHQHQILSSLMEQSIVLILKMSQHSVTVSFGCSDWIISVSPLPDHSSLWLYVAFNLLIICLLSLPPTHILYVVLLSNPNFLSPLSHCNHLMFNCIIPRLKNANMLQLFGPALNSTYCPSSLLLLATSHLVLSCVLLPPGCSDHTSHGPHYVHAACKHDGPSHPADEPSVPGHYRKCEYSMLRHSQLTSGFLNSDMK